MTDQMIINRLRTVSADLRMDKQQYATAHNVSIDAADEVCRAGCANLCDLIADDLDESLKYQEQLKKEEESNGVCRVSV